MEDIQSYISEPNDNAFVAILRETEADSKNVLGLVEKLGLFLTSMDKEERGNATLLLASLLDQVSELPEGDIVHLCDFFCDRIKDHHSIVPHVLSAFSALSRNEKVPDVSAVMMVKSIFQHAEVQTLIQQHRAIAFQIITNLFNNKMDALVMMKEAFTLGYIQMIDGEKDPRNLLTIFQLTQVVIGNFPFGVCCEDLFEVTSCYFPVDFTPPPGDVFQITRQQLVDELRAVMSSTVRFSQYCVPLLIEKISSDLQSAKQDSFATLIQCCKVYSVEELRPFMMTLTQLILKDIMLSPDSKTEQLALQALEHVAKCLAQPVDGVTFLTDVEEYCQIFMKECKQHLFEVNHKLGVPSVKILQTLITSHVHLAEIILSDVLPALLQKLNSSTQVSERGFYLRQLTSLLIGSVTADILTHKNQALPSVVENLYHESDEVFASAVLALKPFYDCLAEKNEEVVKKLLHVIDNSQNKDLRTLCIRSLENICLNSYDSTSDLILGPIIERLNTDNISNISSATLELLHGVSQNCGSKVCTAILPTILTCCQRFFQDRSGKIEAILSSTVLLLNNCPSSMDVSYLQQFLVLCLSQSEEPYYPKITDHINSIIISLVNAANQSHIMEITSKFINEQYRHTIPLVACQSVLCTPKTLGEKESDLISSYSQSCTDKSLNDWARLSACKICCSLINKATQVDSHLEKYSYLLTNKSTMNMQACIWITKALVFRNHKQARSYLDWIMECLSDPEVSHTAATAFDVILSEYSDVLHPSQHPNITSHLYKQRVFVYSFPKLHSMCKTIHPELLANVYSAITNLIRNVPMQVLTSDKKMVMDVLLKLIASDDEQVLLRALAALSEIAGVELLGQHIDTLIPVLLKLTQYQQNMKVRIASLECLGTFSRVDIKLLVPHMEKIIKSLIPSLDDKKRLVRKQAVKTRNTWCLVKDGVTV